MNTDQQIIETFIIAHAPEATRIVEKLSYAEIATFLNQIPSELAARIIEHMNSYRASKSLEQVDISIAVQILTKTDQLITELLIRQYHHDFRRKLLKKIPKELSVKSEKEDFNRQILETGNALGELFRIGITGLLQSTGKFE